MHGNSRRFLDLSEGCCGDCCPSCASSLVIACGSQGWFSSRSEGSRGGRLEQSFARGNHSFFPCLASHAFQAAIAFACSSRLASAAGPKSCLLRSFWGHRGSAGDERLGFFKQLDKFRAYPNNPKAR